MLKLVTGFAVGLILAYLFSSFNPFSTTTTTTTTSKSSTKSSSNQQPAAQQQQERQQPTSCDAKLTKIYRYGVEKTINFTTCDAFEALLNQVRDAQSDKTITRIVTMHGVPVTSAASVPEEVTALNGVEHFIWPTRHVGYATDVVLDRTVQVVTVSSKPRVFRLNNLVSEEECDSM